MPMYEVSGTERFSGKPTVIKLEAQDENQARQLAGLEGLIAEAVREVEPPPGDNPWDDGATTLNNARHNRNWSKGFRVAGMAPWVLLIGSLGSLVCAILIALHGLYTLTGVFDRHFGSVYLTTAILELLVAFAAITLAGIGLALRDWRRSEK